MVLPAHPCPSAVWTAAFAPGSMFVKKGSIERKLSLKHVSIRGRDEQWTILHNFFYLRNHTFITRTSLVITTQLLVTKSNCLVSALRIQGHPLDGSLEAMTSETLSESQATNKKLQSWLPPMISNVILLWRRFGMRSWATWVRSIQTTSFSSHGLPLENQ